MNNLSFRKFPSIIALQCFEAAARHLSFTKASQELHMTQSAVSKQIANLEAIIQNKLFIRTTQYLQITPAGLQYLPHTHEILSKIEASTLAMLLYTSETEILHLASHPTLCSHWLIPMLVGFSKTFPNIRLDIRDHIPSTLQEDQQTFDIAFLSGEGTWAGMDCIKLFNEEMIVVCAPKLYETIQNPVDLTRYVFLQLSSRPTLWQQYFTTQNLKIEDTFTGPTFDTFYACINAAKASCGLALVPKLFVAKELSEGRLICPWQYIFTSDNAYYMIYPTHLSDTSKVKKMINWIQSKSN